MHQGISRKVLAMSNPRTAGKIGAKKYLDRLQQGRNEAVSTVDHQLAYGTHPSAGNPYVNMMRDRYGSGGLAGDSVWGDIGKVFVGNVSQGIGNRIGGHAPVAPASVTIAQANRDAVPTWVKVGGFGAAAVGLFMLLKR